jgi:uncharacterized protein YlzI (FlbEa/FlbD family)
MNEYSCWAFYPYDPLDCESIHTLNPPLIVDLSNNTDTTTEMNNNDKEIMVKKIIWEVNSKIITIGSILKATQ